MDGLQILLSIGMHCHCFRNMLTQACKLNCRIRRVACVPVHLLILHAIYDTKRCTYKHCTRCTNLPLDSLQIAHSIGWFTVSSLLGHYALLYGPQILLFMNIFYYLPSIPLLLFSAFCDDWLDRRFGGQPL